MTRRYCRGCELLGPNMPCPRCEAEAERRAEDRRGRAL